MHVLAVGALLMTLLFVLRLTGSSGLHTRTEKKTVGTTARPNNAHNFTVDCGNITVATNNTIFRCQRDLNQLVDYGYPWSHLGSRRNSKHNLNVRDMNNTLRDALDSLNHVCYIHQRSQACLEENGIGHFCLAITPVGTHLQTDFQFICHRQRRDENLIHSLQCLHDTRLLTMLYFHIADRCRGFSILDYTMRRYKNAYFYALDIKPASYLQIPQLYCLPKFVISSCIRDIVEDHCGKMTADFVQNYLIYLQDRFGAALKSAGLDSDICDHDINSDMMPSSSPMPSGHTKLGISRLLQITAPGTALDTVWGRQSLAYLHSLSEEKLCTAPNAAAAYRACVMSSDDRTERSKFNILQFAAYQLPFLYHGTQCSRLEQFTTCWNLLQEICGPKVRGLEQHATLLAEGCKIQSELDTVGCHWQDMLLRFYINASRVTVWPMADQCLFKPMNLDDVYYGTVNNVMGELDTVISLLQPGVKEISRKCGSQPAKRLTVLFNKLRYLQRDAMKDSILLLKSMAPNY